MFTNRSPPSLRGFQPVVGQYRLVRRVGVGATGEVWQGEHVLTGGVAAIKLLRASAASRASARRFFAREGRAIARLQHPHIVPLFEAGADYLATAFIDGTDLRHRLTSSLEPHLALRMARQIASALDHAHQRGVVHRDIKPANILVDQHDVVYIADFGIARLLDDNEAAGERVGTPAFMAPEQKRGDQVGPAADQYAFGRTMIAMLAGAPLPAESEAALELISAWVPEPLRAALARATAAEPTERFATMAQLVVALADVSLDRAAPRPRRAPLVRAAAPFAWCAAASRVTEVAPGVERADFTLAAVEPTLPAGAAAALRLSTGLGSLGWSVYGAGERLGSVADPAALARARAIAVLAHGFLGTRAGWRAIAPALCRDLGDVLVLTPDLHGSGETRFADGTPTAPPPTPRGLADALFAWLGVLGLRGLTTVLVGHSYAGHALLTLADDELDARTVRVAVTPYINDARNTRLMRVLAMLVRGARRSPLAWKALRSAYVWNQLRINGLAEADVGRMRDELERCDPLFMIRALDLLAGSRIAAGKLDRAFVLFGKDDPLLHHSLVPAVIARLGISAAHARWIASGGHCPFFESQRAPEGVARNRDELVRTIREALDEAACGTVLETRSSVTRSS